MREKPYIRIHGTGEGRAPGSSTGPKGERLKDKDRVAMKIKLYRNSCLLAMALLHPNESGPRAIAKAELRMLDAFELALSEMDSDEAYAKILKILEKE